MNIANRPSRVWYVVRRALLYAMAILVALLPGAAVGQTVPGDVDGNGFVTVTDVFYLINFLFAGGPSPIGGYPAWVARTGQKVCYDGSNVVTACPGTPAGQDGALQKGVAYPNPRFTDNGNGTVTDKMTGLVWLKDAGCFAGLQTWSAAMTLANALASGGCGLTDSSIAGQWRLPNVREQQSLVDYNYFGPAVPNTAGTGQWTAGNPFLHVQSSLYWTSSTYVDNPTYAWSVNLVNGNVYGYDKTFTYFVWTVRGGP
jgi:hypothetical protein